MKAPLAVIAVMAVALGVAALALVGLDDRGTLVPPPEAEAESFMRALATHRYEQALPRAADELRRQGVPALRRWQEDFERARGRVRDVRGLSSRSSGESAEARVALTAGGGEVVLPVRLVRRHGEWRVLSAPE